METVLLGYLVPFYLQVFTGLCQTSWIPAGVGADVNERNPHNQFYQVEINQKLPSPDRRSVIPLDKILDHVVTLTNGNTSQSQQPDCAVGSTLSELDLCLSPAQLAMFDSGRRNGRRRRRQESANGFSLWSNGVIPYVFNSTFLPADRDAILGAMLEWQKSTCIRFRQSQEGDRDLVVFKDGIRCSTNIGRIGQEQVVTLADSCRTKRILIHELGHVIGLIHEHQRHDRDKYVNVLLHNVRNASQERYQFSKLLSKSLTDRMVSYDYTSIMHYGRNYFAKSPELTTLQTTDSLYQDIIGRAERPSFSDIETVNRLYHCSASCPKSLRCEGPCFMDSRCVCRCRASTDQKLHSEPGLYRNNLLDSTCEFLARRGDCSGIMKETIGHLCIKTCRLNQMQLNAHTPVATSTQEPAQSQLMAAFMGSNPNAFHSYNKMNSDNTSQDGLLQNHLNIAGSESTQLQSKTETRPTYLPSQPQSKTETIQTYLPSQPQSKTETLQTYWPSELQSKTETLQTYLPSQPQSKTETLQTYWPSELQSKTETLQTYLPSQPQSKTETLQTYWPSQPQSKTETLQTNLPSQPPSKTETLPTYLPSQPQSKTETLPTYLPSQPQSKTETLPTYLPSQPQSKTETLPTYLPSQPQSKTETLQTYWPSQPQSKTETLQTYWPSLQQLPGRPVILVTLPHATQHNTSNALLSRNLRRQQPMLQRQKLNSSSKVQIATMAHGPVGSERWQQTARVNNRNHRRILVRRTTRIPAVHQRSLLSQKQTTRTMQPYLPGQQKSSRRPTAFMAFPKMTPHNTRNLQRQRIQSQNVAQDTPLSQRHIARASTKKRTFRNLPIGNTRQRDRNVRRFLIRNTTTSPYAYQEHLHHQPQNFSPNVLPHGINSLSALSNIPGEYRRHIVLPYSRQAQPFQTFYNSLLEILVKQQNLLEFLVRQQSLIHAKTADINRYIYIHLLSTQRDNRNCSVNCQLTGWNPHESKETRPYNNNHSTLANEDADRSNRHLVLTDATGPEFGLVFNHTLSNRNDRNLEIVLANDHSLQPPSPGLMQPALAPLSLTHVDHSVSSGLPLDPVFSLPSDLPPQDMPKLEQTALEQLGVNNENQSLLQSVDSVVESTGLGFHTLNP